MVPEESTASANPVLISPRLWRGLRTPATEVRGLGLQFAVSSSPD